MHRYVPAPISDSKWAPDVIEQTTLAIETFDVPKGVTLKDIKALADQVRREFGRESEETSEKDMADIREKRRQREKKERAAARGKRKGTKRKSAVADEL